MRALLALAVLTAAVRAAADDEKLDEKFLVGSWTIKYVTGKSEDTVKKTIEFKDDGTYVWMISKTKKEGTYKLKGTTLELTDKKSKGVTYWKDLSIKDGKLIQPVGQGRYNELTRAEKKEKSPDMSQP